MTSEQFSMVIPGNRRGKVENKLLKASNKYVFVLKTDYKKAANNWTL